MGYPSIGREEARSDRERLRAKASWTSLGNSMIPGMIACFTVQLRHNDSLAKRADFTYFIAVDLRFAKLQLQSARQVGLLVGLICSSVRHLRR